MSESIKNTDVIIDFSELIMLCIHSAEEYFSDQPNEFVKKVWNIFINNFWVWYKDPEFEKEVEDFSYLLKILLNKEVIKLLNVTSKSSDVESLMEGNNLYQIILNTLNEDEEYLDAITGFRISEEKGDTYVITVLDGEERDVFEELTITQETYIEDMCFLIKLLEGNIEENKKGERYIKILGLNEYDIVEKQKFLYI